MGRAIVGVHATVISNLLSDHPGRRVYHEVKANGLPEGARIIDASWDSDARQVLLVVETEQWPTETDVLLPPIEMGAYIVEGEHAAVGT